MLPVLAVAQSPRHAENSSSFDLSMDSAGSPTVEIRNVTYLISGSTAPGRPAGERLMLCKTTKSKQVLGEIGLESMVTLEAWRLGDDPRNKPMFSLAVEGTDGAVVDDALFVVARGLEETEWWSVYKLGSGQHLFDTYMPLASFSIARETLTMRYAGLTVPGDDEKDARLRAPGVVGVVIYASQDGIIREAMLTCKDPQRAQILRSYADTTRTLGWNEGTLKLTFRENYPSPPQPADVSIPVRRDDLDLVHAQLPAGMHLAAWRQQ